MDDLTRSTPVSYLQILLPPEAGEPFVDWCGREGVMHFVDLNEDILWRNRAHTKTIIRAQEAENMVENIEANLTEYDVEFNGEVTNESLNHRRGTENTTLVVQEIYNDVMEKYDALLQQVDVEKRLRKQLRDEKDLADILNDLEYFLDSEKEVSSYLKVSESVTDHDLQVTDVPLLQMSYPYEQQEEYSNVRFQWVAGVIPRTMLWVFKRQLFLSTRGNYYILTGDSVTQQERESDEERETFVVFFLGNRLKKRIVQLSTALDARVLLDSTNVTTVKETFKRQEEDSQLVQQTLELTGEKLQNLMHFLRNQIINWKSRLVQEKSVCLVLNKFKKDSNGMLKIQGWVLSKNFQKVQTWLELNCAELGIANSVIEEILEPADVPPTHFKVNKLTQGFLILIETYGVPRYREYNPAIPSIITFPFLFGVMYGDMLHGFLVFLLAIWLILSEQRLKGKKLGEPMNYLYYGRYILLLMSLFAMYCGWCYNDCMSLTLTLWPSGWDSNSSTWTHVYVFGVDSAWWGKKNEMLFLNSYKMKMSVMFGVTQMTLGLFLKMKNHIYERDWISLLWEFVPQLLFLWSFFGYMCFIILYKWCVNWTLKGRTPPSLVTVLVSIVLNIGVVNDETQLFDSRELQKSVHITIFVIMLCCIPLMLFMKPFMRWRKSRSHSSSNFESIFDGINQQQIVKRAEDFDIGEELIPQVIHTIEFMLGVVSNTASYLRLWALSLAHAQLSNVFFNLCISGPMRSSPGYLFIGVPIFLVVTFMVLLVMDLLECFLHSLRLHWVEFMNKFFYGDGELFEPFQYSKLIEE